MFIDLHLKLFNKTVSMLSLLCVIGGKKAFKMKIHLGTERENLLPETVERIQGSWEG